MKDWFSAQELAGLPGMPSRPFSVRRKAQKNLFKYRDKSRGKGYEYHISSLPAETRAALAARFVEETAPEVATVVSDETIRAAMPSAVFAQAATCAGGLSGANGSMVPAPSPGTGIGYSGPHK